MNQDFETLLLATDENGICTLTVNRPEKLNALNNKVLDELNAAVDIIKDDLKVKAVVITGAGEKAFVAGADIKELSSLDPVSGEKVSKRGQAIFQNLHSAGPPTVWATTCRTTTSMPPCRKR